MSTSISSRSIAFLFICQYMSASWSTRLPLEVYELTPVSATTTATGATSTTKMQQQATNIATFGVRNVANANIAADTQQQQQQQYNLHHYLFKHKNLEYSIIEPAHENDTFNDNSDEDNNNNNNNEDNNNNSYQNKNNTIQTIKMELSRAPLDRRRSRQMFDETTSSVTATSLELSQQQQQQNQQYSNTNNNYHNAATSMYLQKFHQHHHHHHHHQPQQQQQQLHHKQLKDNNNKHEDINDNNNNQDNNIHETMKSQTVLSNNNAAGVGVHVKNVRVLYQVGESEDDLPICAPNAVCSKIDLYEIPWIERQCRCPSTNHIIHLHYNTNKDDEIEIIPKPMNSQSTQHHLSHADKLRNYYEKEKIKQHSSNNNKYLFLSNFNDKNFENLHLKKLMQKLGAVYEDDLQLQPSDLLTDHEENDALATVDEIDEVDESNYMHKTRRIGGMGAAADSKATSAHMRHSGHTGHKSKDISYIGGCPSSLGIEDGHTIADKTRHYKLCQPVHKLPVCKHFRDYTWSLTTSNELNITEQIVHCKCPKNSVTYLTKRQPAGDGLSGYTYLFACSPLTRIRCQRKQPCKLFTVRKRQEFLDEVNINALCQCPKGHHCPSHHTQSGVIAGESFIEDNIQTYSGYCMAND